MGNLRPRYNGREIRTGEGRTLKGVPIIGAVDNPGDILDRACSLGGGNIDPKRLAKYVISESAGYAEILHQIADGFDLDSESREVVLLTGALIYRVLEEIERPLVRRDAEQMRRAQKRIDQLSERNSNLYSVLRQTEQHQVSFSQRLRSFLGLRNSSKADELRGSQERINQLLGEIARYESENRKLIVLNKELRRKSRSRSAGRNSWPSPLDLRRKNRVRPLYGAAAKLTAHHDAKLAISVDETLGGSEHVPEYAGTFIDSPAEDDTVFMEEIGHFDVSQGLSNGGCDYLSEV